ncbi:toxin-antitoxin system YwqK family antitoxin [Phaeocystidibacter luteus]|nr:hypothetical protein [Phaeocystidibacter luteus]
MKNLTLSTLFLAFLFLKQSNANAQVSPRIFDTAILKVDSVLVLKSTDSAFSIEVFYDSTGIFQIINETSDTNSALYFDEAQYLVAFTRCARDTCWEYEYYKNGILKSVHAYNTNEDDYIKYPYRSVYRRKYDCDGRIKEEREYEYGTQVSRVRGYFPNGQLKFEGQASDWHGEFGLFHYYHPNGRLESKGEYVRSESPLEESQKVGVWQYFDEDGVLINEENYSE